MTTHPTDDVPGNTPSNLEGARGTCSPSPAKANDGDLTRGDAPANAPSPTIGPMNRASLREDRDECARLAVETAKDLQMVCFAVNYGESVRHLAQVLKGHAELILELTDKLEGK